MPPCGRMRCLEKGDLDGKAAWTRILRAVESILSVP